MGLKLDHLRVEAHFEPLVLVLCHAYPSPALLRGGTQELPIIICAVQHSK